MSFPRYQKHKDSGVEWLGQVPEHWDVKRLKFISRLPIQNGIGAASDTDNPEFPRYVRITDIKSSKELHSDTFRSLPIELAETAKFTVGDILFACVGATFGKSYLHSVEIGPVCYAGYLVKFSPSQSTDSRFISYWSECGHYWAQLNSNVIQSTVQNFSASKYRELELALPAYAEQIAIADFLDRETKMIDSLVSEQERLMELLKEKRQAVITHAVTKGLNPSVSLKPSGIEWLGDVPEHWKILRLSYNAAIENGTTPSRENPDYWLGGDVPWLSSGEVNQYRITEAKEFITTKALKECSLRLLPKGTIVIGMIGQGKTRGLSASLEIEASINQNLAAIVPGKNLKPDYLLYIFQSVYEYLREFGRGGNQAALNCEILSGLKTPLPPFEEQNQICAYIKSRLNEFDTLTDEAQRAIDLLQERRTALISAAVTGQIDVRPLLKKEAA